MQPASRLRSSAEAVRCSLRARLPLFFLLLLGFGCASPRRGVGLKQPGTLLSPSSLAPGDKPAALELSGKDPIRGMRAHVAANSPELRSAYEDWAAAVAKIAQARSLPNPQLRYAYYLREVETRVGPQRQRFGVTQRIPWLRKLSLDADIAAAKAQSLARRFEALELKLYAKLESNYYELYYIRQSIAVTKEAIELVRSHERIARVRLRTSGGGGMKRRSAGSAQADVIRAQVELGRLEDQLESRRDMRRPISAAINALLNRAPDAKLPIAALPKTRAIVKERELLKEMRSSNRDLAIITANIETAEQGIDRAKQNYYPDLSLGLDLIDTRRANKSGLNDSGKDPIVLSFGLSLPLWQSKYAAGVREARAKKRSAIASRSATRRRLETALERAFFSLREARRRSDLYLKTLIPKAEESQRAMQRSFEAGRGDFLGLLDVERTLLEFQLQHERARTNRAKTLSTIEQLVGRALERKP